MTTLRIVTRMAPITSDASSERVITRISVNASEDTPRSPTSASHHHWCVVRIPVLCRNWLANSPISIVEPQPIAM
jgi:hypothetical protein